MIFVTVGTEKFPFDRLLEAIEEAIKNREIDHEVFAQIGNSNFKPKLFGYEKFIDFEEMIRFIQESEIVVSHSGVGSTILCLSSGKVPILFPRRAAFGEHIDNHQIEFARRMDTLGKVLVAHNERELIYKIINYKKIVAQLKPSFGRSGRDRLINYLKMICNQRVEK